MSHDRFSIHAGELVFIPRESDDDRADAFLETLKLPREGGVFIDCAGHPLVFTRASTENLDHYASAELGRVAQAIARPDEIRHHWKRDAGGTLRLTRRYIANTGDVDVAVDINKAGWCFATSDDSGFDMERVRHGTPVWPPSD